MSQALSSDQQEFQRLARQHGKALQLHCYRMTGSLHDAEDLVQETFLRAWRALDRFEGRASMRNWLYRIATNACLSALALRGSTSARRVLPEELGGPSDPMPGRVPATEQAWLQPYPDIALEDIAELGPGPDARYESKEAVQLAFVAALHYLPARQRAILLLRDVLGWSAHECAETLDTSVASITSALQRARATMAKHHSAARPCAVPRPVGEQRTLLDAYVRAWENHDVAAFVALLTDDAIMSMPPWHEWYQGRDAIGRFFAWTGRPGGPSPFRLLPTAGNGQPAFAFYTHRDGIAWRAHSIQLITFEGDAIARMISFVDPTLLKAFACPAQL